MFENIKLTGKYFHCTANILGSYNISRVFFKEAHTHTRYNTHKNSSIGFIRGKKIVIPIF